MAAMCGGYFYPCACIGASDSALGRLQDIRLKYYDMMIVLHQARHESLSLCKDFQAVLMTRGIG